jgi:hypothetical protein
MRMPSLPVSPGTTRLILIKTIATDSDWFLDRATLAQLTLSPYISYYKFYYGVSYAQLFQVGSFDRNYLYKIYRPCEVGHVKQGRQARTV